MGVFNSQGNCTFLRICPFLLDCTFSQHIVSWSLFCSNLFGAVLGLCCCVGFSLVVASGGCSLVVVHELIAVTSLIVEHRLQGMQASVVVAPGL